MPLTILPAIRLLLPPCKVHLIPVEILMEIFLLIEIDWPEHYKDLMLVCRRWRDIILSIPGITSELRIRRSTKVEVVQAFIQGRKSRLAVIVDVNDERHGKDFNADDFHASFIAATQAAPRWHGLHLISFPPPGEYKVSHTITQPLESLRYFSMSHSCDLGKSFEPLLTAITTHAPHLIRLCFHNISALLYLVQPARIHVFCSLTILDIWLPKRMEGHIDILPHLQRVETFQARHLFLPIYPPDASLPPIQTLSHLKLNCVSVQWMADKVFPVLQLCSIASPHNIDAICLRPVTMPACTFLEYAANDLDPLRHFHHPPLGVLKVTSGQWNVKRGNLQLVAMGPIIIASAQNLTYLHLQVQCSERLLVYMLGLLPALYWLSLGLASPNALSEVFFRAFTATSANGDSPREMVKVPGQVIDPLCGELRELDLHYKRWLRGPEKRALIPVFSDIVSSRGKALSLSLSFDGPVREWLVGMARRRLHRAQDYGEFIIGISSRHGIVPLERNRAVPLMEVPFKEAEYLAARGQLSSDCLSTLHRIVELRIEDLKDIQATALPLNLPLLHTLRVLEAKTVHSSFLAGRTFHRLERCRMSLYGEGPKLSLGQVTQMPVCTRLDVDDLAVLATFKLPKISELSVSLGHPEFNMIWREHIAVNANLSGLKLLHVYRWHQWADLVQALRCLPVLKSLILGNGSDLDADFFEEFVPLDPNGPSVLKQSSDSGQISGILCPMLNSILIEEDDLSKQLEPIPVLEEVVTLHAMAGYPLESFALSHLALGRRFELIGSHGSFVVAMVVLGEGAKRFRLEI